MRLKWDSVAKIYTPCPQQPIARAMGRVRCSSRLDFTFFSKGFPACVSTSPSHWPSFGLLVLPLALGDWSPFPLTARGSLGTQHLQPGTGSSPGGAAQILLPRTISDVWGKVIAHLRVYSRLKIS